MPGFSAGLRKKAAIAHLVLGHGCRQRRVVVPVHDDRALALVDFGSGALDRADQVVLLRGVEPVATDQRRGRRHGRDQPSGGRAVGRKLVQDLAPEHLHVLRDAADEGQHRSAPERPRDGRHHHRVPRLAPQPHLQRAAEPGPVRLTHQNNGNLLAVPRHKRAQLGLEWPQHRVQRVVAQPVDERVEDRPRRVSPQPEVLELDRMAVQPVQHDEQRRRLRRAGRSGTTRGARR